MGILKAFWPLLVISTLLGYLIREALPFSFLSLSQVGIAFIFLSIIGVVLLTIGDKKLSNYLKSAKVKRVSYVNSHSYLLIIQYLMVFD